MGGFLSGSSLPGFRFFWNGRGAIPPADLRLQPITVMNLGILHWPDGGGVALSSRNHEGRRGENRRGKRHKSGNFDPKHGEWVVMRTHHVTRKEI